ncbi:MAG: hypothetical protein P8182_00415 [Deltaproteobacteria bacterium]
MTPLTLYPLKLLGWAAVGLALGAGWKLGSHLVDVAMGERELNWPKLGELVKPCETDQPLWKRRFTKISEA